MRPGSEIEQLAAIYNESGHSIFGPSASAMWLYCSGSLIANLMEPDSTSFEAAEGTVAHAMGEEWLKTGVRPTHRVGTVEIIEENGERFEILITNSMLDYVQEYVDWCQYLPGEHYTEVKVYFGDLMPIPNQGGTCDHAACLPGRLVVTDLKYGKGIQVFAEENTQALLYALGFYLKYNDQYGFKEIEIRIAQPRLEHFDVWVVTEEYLLEFAEYVRERAKKAWVIDAPRHPRPKSCQWCRAKSDCPAILKLIDSVLEGRINDLDREFSHDELESLMDSLTRGTYALKPVHVDKLKPEQLAKLLPYRRMVETWFVSVFLRLEGMALDGKEVPDHKLVEARTNREFKSGSEKELVEWLQLIGLEHEDIYNVDMRSPNQIEEIIRDKFGVSRKSVPGLIASYVNKPNGKPTLVHHTDKRPPLDDIVDDAFSDDDDLDDVFSDDDEL